MARVPVTPNRSVQVQPLDTRPLRYSRSRNYVGEAVSDFGGAVQRAAQDWDAIEAAYDQADVLNLDNTYASELSAAQSEFSTLRGDQPGRELQDRFKTIEERAEQLVGAARSERAKNLAKRALSVRLRNAQERMTAHSDREMLEFRDTALVAGRQQAALDAIGSAGTEQFEVNIGVGLTRIQERAALNGSPPELVALEQSKFLDEVHGGVLDTKFAAPDPDIDDILEYVNAFGADMTPALKNQTLARLQGPLQGRVARSDADLVLGFASPVEGAEAGTAPPLAIPSDSPQGAVGNTLTQAGFSSAVVAGFLGNFDVEGGYDGARGDGGTASGIAQWRHDRRDNFRRKYGKDPHEATLAEQAEFVVWEMQNPAKAGMTEAQRDAILNAGSPSEAAALIDQHYERSSGAHRARRQEAAEKYGGAYAPSPREWDRAQVYANLDAVAEREGWNPERTERTRAELDKRISRDEGLLREQQADADEQATAIVQERGDGFTSTNMIPREIWNRLSPSDKIAWEKVADANSKPTEPAANGARAMELNLMRYYEPEAFKSLNLAKFAGEMTRAELDTMLSTQARMRTNEGQWSPRSGIVTALNYGKKINRLDLDAEGEAAILQIMEAEAWRMHDANGGKALTEADYQTLFRSATRTVQTTERFLGFATGTNERPRYELTLSMMPESTRERLTKRLEDSGLEASDENLLRLYRLETR